MPKTAEVTAHTVHIHGDHPTQATILECTTCGPLGVHNRTATYTRLYSVGHIKLHMAQEQA